MVISFLPIHSFFYIHLKLTLNACKKFELISWHLKCIEADEVGTKIDSLSKWIKSRCWRILNWSVFLKLSIDYWRRFWHANRLTDYLISSYLSMIQLDHNLWNLHPFVRNGYYICSMGICSFLVTNVPKLVTVQVTIHWFFVFCCLHPLNNDNYHACTSAKKYFQKFKELAHQNPKFGFI